VTNLLLDYGLVLLFVVVVVESAGIPFLPGETALIAAAVLARTDGHRYSLFWVIVVAATAAVVGYSVAYWVGRLGGRRLVERWTFTQRYAEKALPPGERFFQKHGAKTVFFGRFIVFLRATVGWLAGITDMPWWRFLAWNVAGGIVWATGVALLAYWAGKSAADAIGRYGVYGVVGLVILGALAYGGLRVWRKRIEAA
jgi:membrane protein DedA with SNARE-associated domain